MTRHSLCDALLHLKQELSIPVVHVTHNISEALYLADDILPMISGKIVRKWMVQFMLKGRPAQQVKISGGIDDFDYDDTMDLSVLYDSLEVMQ